MRKRNKKTGQFEKTLPVLLKNCVVCGSSYQCANLTKFRTAKYCSKKCLGRHNSEIRSGKKPYKMTNEIKKKISQSKMGTSIWGGEREMPWLIGERHHMWLGDNASYRNKHRWVVKWGGKASCCEICGKNSGTRFHWANKDHQYKRILEDYIQLCPKCHYQYDAEHGLRKQSRKEHLEFSN